MNEVSELTATDVLKEEFAINNYGLSTAEKRHLDNELHLIDKINECLLVTKNMDPENTENRIEKQVELNERLEYAKKYGYDIALSTYEKLNSSDNKFSKSGLSR